MKTLRLAIAVVIALSGFQLYAQSQSSAQIQGTVQDASGGAVPGADVKVTQTDTSAVRTATTSADGTYVLANLPIGPYRLEVTKQGFTTYIQTGIVLQVATNPTVDVSLKVGAVSEQVQVEANAALVETEATGVGHVIENQRILELPLNGRLATDLIALVPATFNAGIAGTAGFPNTFNFVVAGGQAYGNTFWLDGALAINFYDGANQPFPFPDALQEFKVETSSLTAQNGLKSGAAVNAVTRSGSNNFHGDAFEFLRNGDLNARNFFAPIRDSLKRNQFGGTTGGPILKNKLFFFGGYQGTITRQNPTSSGSTVPTAAMLNGDFSACPADMPAALQTQYGGTKIPVSQYYAGSLKLAAALPSSTAPCGTTTYPIETQINEAQGVGRLDYQLSSKQNLFARYIGTTYFRPTALSLNPTNILSSTQGALNDFATSAILGHTYIISATIVNQFRASYSREAISRYNSNTFSGCDLGAAAYCGFVPHQSSFSGAGFSIGGGTIVKGTNDTNEYQLSDDVSIIRGSHQFGFGVTAVQQRSALQTNVYSQGNFSFSSMAGFLLGQLNGYTMSMPNTLPVFNGYVGTYAQDTWKVTKRLTANIGVRWNPNFPPNITDGEIYNFSMANFLNGTKSSIYTNAPPGLLYPGDAACPNGKACINKQWNLFAPRLGLAWDPTGQGRMTIRAGFGISFSQFASNLLVNPADAPPFGDTVMTSGATLANPFSTNPGGNIFPITFNQNAPFVTYGTYIAVPPNLPTERTNQWNLAVQRQLGTSWLLSATYIGAETEHLLGSYQMNPGVYIPGNCVAGQYGLTAPGLCSTTANTNYRRVLSLTGLPYAQYYGATDTLDGEGTSSYNGLILAVQRRMSKGIAIDGNYTWSHCIGDVNIGEATGNAESGQILANDRRYDRSNCQSSGIYGTSSADHRQVFNLSVVGQAPGFSNKLTNAIVHGWQLAVIYRVSSGGWLTVTQSTADVAGTGASGQRPNEILSDPLCANPSFSCWLNPNAFATAAPGTLGNMGRDNIPGPGSWTFDTALSRTFRVREGMNLQARIEAFNLPNAVRAGSSPTGAGASVTSGVVTGFTSGTFGTITSAQDPRIMQGSLKFTF